MVSWFAVGATFDVVGKVLIGLTVLLVHHRLMKEHKIDKLVLKEMERERVVGVSGILSIIVGYSIHIFTL